MGVCCSARTINTLPLHLWFVLARLDNLNVLSVSTYSTFVVSRLVCVPRGCSDTPEISPSVSTDNVLARRQLHLYVVVETIPRSTRICAS